MWYQNYSSIKFSFPPPKKIKKKKEKEKDKHSSKREEEVDQATHGSLGDQVNPLNKRFFFI